MHESTETAAEPLLVFTDSAAVKVGELIREEGNPNLKLRVFVSGRRLLGLPVRLHVRRERGRRRHLRREPGRQAAHRPDELPVPRGRRDRLPRRSRGRAVRDPQSQRDDDLRLRVVVLGLTRAWSAPTPRRARTSWRRSTSGPTASTWSSRATRTASSSSSTACARWCGSPPGSTSRAASNRESTARALACLERFGQRLRDMQAGQRARGRHQHAAQARSARAPSSTARARRSATRSRSSPGIEEARLIYSGVAHTTPSEAGHRLVVDIGGGSTELIIGEGLSRSAAREPVDRLREHERRALRATARSPRSA